MTSLRAAIRVALACLGIAIATGCGSDGADAGTGDGGGGSDSVPEGPRVVLGSGREAFEDVREDGVVPLIHGIQGGFHVWTSFLIYGFDTDVVRMEIATRWDGLDDSLVEMKGNVAVRPTTDPAGMPALVSLGWTAYIFEPQCANGQTLDLALTVRDQKSGISASDDARWVVDVAEEDRLTDCGG